MNNLKIFNNSEFGEIRTMQEGDKTLFCGNDVAKALGYGEPHKAVTRRCKNGGMKHPVIDSMRRTQEAIFIPESDVYRFITHSKLPTAKAFKRWITHEVIPSIRKHGD